MSELISIEQAARRLGVSRQFVLTMVGKGRLSPVGVDQLAVAEVDALKTLVDKLKADGIAAMVNIAGTSPERLN